jgi:hypothetical protein
MFVQSSQMELGGWLIGIVKRKIYGGSYMV